MQNKELNFSNQSFFIGLDVHKKTWSVTVRTNRMELKTFTMNPSPEELSKYLKRHYPGGRYLSVYEAGFSGYWIDRKLRKYGIENIVVSPADIPTRNKERVVKNDAIDSRKLSRELENGTLQGIYVPEVLQEKLRSYCRIRYQLTGNQTRLKNRIKGYLAYSGKKTPENYEVRNWSGKFIKYLEEIEFEDKVGRECLALYLEELKESRERLSRVLLRLREYSKEYGFKPLLDRLQSVPGIGFITAVTLYTELMDMKRFKRPDDLASYVGLVPSVHSSGEKERVLGLSHRYSKFLRSLLIEASWVAVRKDPALTQKYNELIQKMSKQKAIIRIAKKLLYRIQHVWNKEESYVYSVVA
ncbi:MAG TPA: IS110 family transposase [Ignavibacteriales bacterium]|nr:IS110 family transposase [Ignavibacteriales bacterium]